MNIRKIVREVNVVLEVLDARNPNGTRSVSIERYIRERGKVLLFVLNKCDLAGDGIEKVKRDLSGIAPTVYTSATKKLGTRRLRNLIRKHAPSLPTKVALVGYPNVGKSQLVNALKGRTVAGISPVPGYTRGVQWIRISKNIQLHDTPGVIPHGEGEKSLALKMAVEADRMKDPVGGAVAIIEHLLKEDPEAVYERYGVTGDPDEILEEIARKRGKLKKGGEPDLTAASKIVIREWQRGKIKYKKKENKNTTTSGEASKKLR